MTAQTILPANSVLDTGFSVANSARFEGVTPDSLRLAAAGNDGDQKHWTVSMWIKRSKLATLQHVWSWSRNNTNAEGGFAFDTNDQIFFISDGQNGGTNEIDGVFRDTSAWFHLVWSCDADNGTNALRWRVYINGVERAITGDPTIQDANGIVNRGSSQEHWIGGRSRSLNSNTDDAPFSGYIAEVVFIDDATLAPTSFGEFDEDSGIWKPLKSVEDLTFGAKGYYLNFQDSAELGTDVSGNDYDFAETGLTAIDQSTDTCTNNFATYNPLQVQIGTANEPVFREGNLHIHGSTTGAILFHAASTIGVSKGKWYAEFKGGSASNQNGMVGVTYDPGEDARNDDYPGEQSHSYGYYVNGNKYTSDNAASYGDAWTTDIIGVALDLDNHKLYFSKNGTWQNSGDPESGSTGTGSAFDLTTGQTYFFATGDGNATYVNPFEANFGGCSVSAISSGNADGDGFGNFEFAVPSGYFALCTKNLAEYG